jgi:hypothetical protein
MSDGGKLRPPVKARVRSAEQWLSAAAEEIRGYMAELGASGLSLWDIAAGLNCGRTALWSWRTGAADMPTSKFLKLRKWAGEVAAKRRVV